MAEGTARAVTIIAIILICVLPSFVFSQGLSKDAEEKLRALAIPRQRELPMSRVDSILQHARSNPDVKEIIENEFMVRTKFSLVFNKECTIAVHTPLNIDKPPATIKEYIAWQKAIIAAPEALCDAQKGFFCAQREQCLCSKDFVNGKVALVVSPPGAAEVLIDSDEECLRPIGGTCGQNDPSPKYFDPLLQIQEGDSGTIPLPTFRGEFRHCERSPRASKGVPFPCRKLDFFPDSRCQTFDVDETNGKLVDAVTSLMTLGAGSTCNQENSKKLFNPDPAETYEAAVTRLQKTVDDEKVNSTGFCDVRQLVTCGAGGTCECLAPFNLNSATNKCDIPLWSICGRAGSHEAGLVEFIKDKTLNNLVQRGVQMGLAKAKCDSRSDCVVGPIVEGEMYKVCACKVGKIGENCNIEPTGLLKKVKPSAYPSDVTDPLQQLKILEEFNAKIIPFEKHMTQPEGKPCNEAREKEAMEVRKFIQGLEDADVSIEMRSLRTRQKYLDIGAKAVSASKGEILCANDVKCTDGKCRVISQEQELKDALEKVRKFATLKEGEACMFNNSAPETSIDDQIIHLNNLAKMGKPLCLLDTDLQCLPKNGQLGFCQCPPALQNGCKTQPDGGANATKSTAGIEGYQTRIPVPTILMIVFALIFSK